MKRVLPKAGRENWDGDAREHEVEGKSVAYYYLSRCQTPQKPLTASFYLKPSQGLAALLLESQTSETVMLGPAHFGDPSLSSAQVMSKGVASSTPPKKDKEKKQKDKKKKEGWHLYSLFKKSKGFDRNVSAIPPIVREPIEWLYSHNGTALWRFDSFCYLQAAQLHVDELPGRLEDPDFALFGPISFPTPTDLFLHI